MVFISKVLLAALVIAFASWLSGKKPELSGFIIALPIASIIAIAFSYLEHKNTENTVIFAKSILICLLYTSPSPRDYAASRMPSSA